MYYYCVKYDEVIYFGTLVHLSRLYPLVSKKYFFVACLDGSTYINKLISYKINYFSFISIQSTHP